MDKKRLRHLMISIFWCTAGLILSWTYRPYIYNNGIFDFHLADTIGNWVAVPAATNFILAVSKKEEKLEKVILTVVCAYILYEFLGLAGIHGTFDWYDMIATVLCGMLTWLVMRKKTKQQPT